MNSRQEKTLTAIFHNPIRADLSWEQIESLLQALGAVVEEGNGSRVRVSLNDCQAVFHRPHPQKEVKRYVIRELRQYLQKAGIRPL